MPENKPTIKYTYEILTMLAGRLRDAAEDLAADLELGDMISGDLRLAATALSRFASLRYRIAEIAAMSITTALVREALDQALTEAEQG